MLLVMPVQRLEVLPIVRWVYCAGGARLLQTVRRLVSRVRVRESGEELGGKREEQVQSDM